MKRHGAQTKRRGVHGLDDAKAADGLARPHSREGALSTIPAARRASGFGNIGRDDARCRQPRLVPSCTARTVIIIDLHSQAGVASRENHHEGVEKPLAKGTDNAKKS